MEEAATYKSSVTRAEDEEYPRHMTDAAVNLTSGVSLAPHVHGGEWRCYNAALHRHLPMARLYTMRAPPRRVGGESASRCAGDAENFTAGISPCNILGASGRRTTGA